MTRLTAWHGGSKMNKSGYCRTNWVEGKGYFSLWHVLHDFFVVFFNELNPNSWWFTNTAFCCKSAAVSPYWRGEVNFFRSQRFSDITMFSKDVGELNLNHILEYEFYRKIAVIAEEVDLSIKRAWKSAFSKFQNYFLQNYRGSVLNSR